mgnify:CR=1 FL=1|tara:strand:- start:576 stop:779 length:204 start_codon:yes stop_codon:yes gene_type:complete
MNKLVMFLKGFAADYVSKYFKDNKKEVIGKLNKKIDIKFLTEQQEQQLLEALYEVVIEGIDTLKDKK